MPIYSFGLPVIQAIRRAAGAALKWTLNNPTAYSTSAGDNFGHAVAIDGNYAIVTARYEDDAGGADSGKAYIYNTSTGALLFTLNNPNAYSTSANDQFGYSAALSGNYAAVGAFERDASGASSGKVYVFNVTTGALVSTINNPNAYGTSADDLFGWSVAVSGNYVIVGAPYEDQTSNAMAGKTYIFTASNGSLHFTLNDPNAYSTAAYDQFGWSVAISGNYAVVGVPYEGDAGGSNSGKLYVYNVLNGTLARTINNPNSSGTSSGDQFGYSVAMSGNYAIVGAPYENNAGGAAYIFDVTTGSLIHTMTNPNNYGTGSNDNFGWSVSISSNYAIVGAYAEDDAGGTDSGKSYIYSVSTGALLYTLDNPNAYGTSDADNFGYSVGISGNTAIVSAYREDDAGGTQSGKAYIYELS